VSSPQLDNYVIGEFLQLLRNFKAGRIDKRGVRASVQGLCRGNTNLILYLHSLLPKKYQTTLPFQLHNPEMTGVKGKKLKNIEVNIELPWDVLDIISKKLDFEDLFHFSGVCKNWRAFHKIYLRNFLAYQEPLLLRILYDVGTRDSLSLISMHDKKVFRFKMCFLKTSYVASSGGYFIKVGTNNSFLLINPFTRIKKVINASTFKVVPATIANDALLAFSKCSDEFVLVVLSFFYNGLRVYHSRNSGWVTYSKKVEKGETVVHFVVWHNIIYVVTNKANIGVLSLNSPNIKFLKLKNTPDVDNVEIKLVNGDEQLLVADLTPRKLRNVYKIDFSTMSYVKMETLGDIALLCALDQFKTDCYALSNPNTWGYESNSVYVTSLSSTVCRVFSGDDKKLKKCITLPTAEEANYFVYDWCFKHLRCEVDYSLVE
jgi:hypothetical protein